MPVHDVFPSTVTTWIGQKLAEGDAGRAQLNRHVMSVYSQPLKAYFFGTSRRWLGDPDEIVHGFFADRLARNGFFESWRSSGLRLRRWLMNAFSYYLLELHRKRRKDRRAVELSESEELPSPEEEPEKAMDRAFVESVIRQSLLEAQKVCHSEGLDEHWRIFLRHYHEGLPYDSFSSDFRVEPARAAVMARTGANKFRRALRDLIAQDGAKAEEIDVEIKNLLEIISS